MTNVADSSEERPEFETGIKRLSLDSLTVDWITNVRSDINIGIEGLAESIERHGLQHPIVVRPSPSTPGMFEIVEGSRRVSAFRMLSQKDARYKRIEARVLENCSDLQAAVLSFEENDKRGDLNAREVHAYINILLRSAPENGKKGLAYVARQLGWTKTIREGKKKRTYADIRRVRLAIEDGEFQTIVPGIELKYRSRGDVDKKAVPITVAREAKQAVYAAKAKLGPAANDRLAAFLLAYAKATPPNLRKQLRIRFIEAPERPIEDILNEVVAHASQPSLELVMPVRIPMDWSERIEAWQYRHDSWTRSAAIRDLIERGLATLDL